MQLPAIDNEPLAIQRIERDDGTRCLVLHAGNGHAGLELEHAQRLRYALGRAIEWATHRSSGRWPDRD